MQETGLEFRGQEKGWEFHKSSLEVQETGWEVQDIGLEVKETGCGV